MKKNTINNFKLFGFATGEYIGKCSECGAEFIGDKRSKQCLNCAINFAENICVDYILKTKIQKCNLQYPADCGSKIYYPDFEGCGNTTKKCAYREEVILILQKEGKR